MLLQWIIGIALVCTPLVLLASAARSYWSLRRLRRTGTRKVGEAVAIPTSEDAVTLRVTFLDDAGVAHTVESHGASTTWAHPPKAEAVLYPPGRPDKARIEADLVHQESLGLYLGAFLGVLYVVLVVLAFTL